MGIKMRIELTNDKEKRTIYNVSCIYVGAKCLRINKYYPPTNDEIFYEDVNYDMYTEITIIDD